MIRGRILYVTANKQTDLQGRHYAGATRHNTARPSLNLSLPDPNNEFLELYVAKTMKVQITRKRRKLERQLKRRKAHGGNEKMFNKLISLMRDQLELTMREIKLCDDTPRYKERHYDTYLDLIATREHLTGTLALLDK